MITKEEAIKAYEDLIQLRRSEVLIKDKTNIGKIEIHHILPKSCGGLDVNDNKIVLYAKEHFMAHVYLWIIHHDDEFHKQTVYALIGMCKGTISGSRQELRDFILKSEEYQKAREEFVKHLSDIRKHTEPQNKNKIKYINILNNHILYLANNEPVPFNYIKAAKNTICCINIKSKQRLYIYKNNSIPTGYIKSFRKRPRNSVSKDAKHQAYIEEVQQMADYFTKYGYDATCKKFPGRPGTCSIEAMLMRFIRARKLYGIKFKSKPNGNAKKRNFVV